MSRDIFDPDFEPVLTKGILRRAWTSSPAARTTLTRRDSREVEALEEYRSSRVAKVKGKIIEQVYRAGG
jgi:hypothetical protein